MNVYNAFNKLKRDLGSLKAPQVIIEPHHIELSKYDKSNNFDEIQVANNADVKKNKRHVRVP